MKLSFNLHKKQFSPDQLIAASLVILVLLILGIFSFSPYPLLNPNVQAGNLGLNGELKTFALDSFKKAENEWPWIQYNYYYLRKVNQAKKAQEDYKKDKAALIVFLKPDVTTEDKNKILKLLENYPGVRLGKYISSEDALQIYKERNKNEPALLEMVTPNILPPSIEVYLNDWSKRNELKGVLLKYTSVEQVIVSMESVSI